MNVIFEDCVMETTTTGGTGPVALAGTQPGYRRFSQVCAVGSGFYYSLAEVNASGQRVGDWEVGLGVYSADNQLTRLTVLSGSNGTNPVNFGTGQKIVYMTMAAKVMHDLVRYTRIVGEVRAVAFAAAPVGWALCNGATMLIADQPALFAAIGNAFGGDGVTDFKVPDMRGRVPVGAGAGPGLTAVALAESGGANTAPANGIGTADVTLLETHMPAHTHSASVDVSGLTAAPDVQVSTGASGLLTVNAGDYLSATVGGPSGAAIYVAPGSAGTTVSLGGVTATVGGAATASIGSAGGGTMLEAPVTTTATVDVAQPYLGLNFIIALTTYRADEFVVAL